MNNAGDEIEKVLREQPDKWFTTKEIIEQTGFRNGRVGNAMRQLVVRNIVLKEIDDKNQIYYRLNPEEK